MSALVTCPDCGASVSQMAVACPKCGHPFKTAKSVSSGVFQGLFTFFIGLPLICVGAFLALGTIGLSCDEHEKRVAAEAADKAAQETARMAREAQQRMEEERRLRESSPEWIAAKERQLAEQRERERLAAAALAEEQAREEEERQRPARELRAKVVKNQLINASNGLPYAQYELGLRYARGDGVESNRALALHWLNAACSNGHSQASNAISKLGLLSKTFP